MHLNLAALCTTVALSGGAAGMSALQPIAQLLAQEDEQGVWQSDGYGLVVAEQDTPAFVLRAGQTP